ncbi:MAG: site-specific DNA-methyltransferase [Ignavibacteria bacterium]|nr:site-specific DNA-methyltransferase [Ignavibacteria bacterium]
MIKIEIDNIYNLDCIEGMKFIPDSFVDLIITDPPFAIDFKAKKENYNRKSERVIEGYNEIPKQLYYDFTIQWMSQAFRVLKETGSMFVFSGWNNLKDILNAIDALGFITVNHIIWKYQFGVVTKRKFVTSHYHCLYVCKNEKKRKFFPYARFTPDAKDNDGTSLHYKDKEDVWFIKREYWAGSVKTPTKLPAELITKILLYTSEKGDIVLDPFLGSGQVALVAKSLERHYIGFEIVKEYYEFAAKRLNENNYKIKDFKNFEEDNSKSMINLFKLLDVG